MTAEVTDLGLLGVYTLSIISHLELTCVLGTYSVIFLLDQTE